MDFLRRKNVVISVRRYCIDAMGLMTWGLFASLLIGMILRNAGSLLGVPLLERFSGYAIQAMGPAICIAVAYALQAPPLVLFSSTAVGIAAVSSGGGPVGCFLAALVAAECGKLVSKETKLDILVTPAVTLLSGIAVAVFAGPPIGSFMVWLGSVIETATTLHPIPMGMIVALLMGLILTSPVSSAAIAMMLGLSGLAAGAATVGCCAQMVGFAVISFRDNGISGLTVQGIGTSMVQIPNIVRNPLILIPPTVAGTVLGAVATTLVPMQNIPEGAGMGSCGLVGQIGTIQAMGFSSEVIVQIALMHFILPAALSFVVYALMRRKGWIKDGDMKLSAV